MYLLVYLLVGSYQLPFLCLVNPVTLNHFTTTSCGHGHLLITTNNTGNKAVLKPHTRSALPCKFNFFKFIPLSSLRQACRRRRCPVVYSLNQGFDFLNAAISPIVRSGSGRSRTSTPLACPILENVEVITLGSHLHDTALLITEATALFS